MWADQDSYGTVLLAMGLHAYAGGTSGYDSPVYWTARTWVQHVREDYGVDLSVRNTDKLQAACLVLTRPDEVRLSAATFGDVALGLSAAYFDPDVWHPPGIDESLWAVIETALLDGFNDHIPYGPAVQTYVNMIAKRAGFASLPEVFGAFGVDPVESVWRGTVGYASDPTLAVAVAEASAAREEDLLSDAADHVRALSNQIGSLPVGVDVAPVRAELDRYAAVLSAPGPVSSE